jgi:aspartyl-tRNA(Asn)/glutamyl-tRNA(Gln) amidotransferase subunit A
VVERTAVQVVSPLDPSTLTIVDAATQIRTGEITARELTEACLDRIARDNPRLNAFITVTADLARAQADEADRDLKEGHDRGPLHGIPISIKDLIDIKGLPTTAASHVRKGHIASRDAPIIVHLRLAGAVFVGKTNLHEFAMGTTNEDSAFGPALHPRDPTRSPGGSSGGSAVSVVAGMCLASVGSDTGGSIRIPSAACGLVGLKPAWGELSCDGVVPLGQSLDCVGPLARTVTDAWIMYAGLARYGMTFTRKSDRFALGVSPLSGASQEASTPLEDAANRFASGLRLALLDDYFLDRLQSEVRTRFDAAITLLREAVETIDPIDLRYARLAPSMYLPTVLAEGAEYHARTIEQIPEAYTPNVRARFELGRYVLAEDYLRAQRGREALRAEINSALEDYDALVLPTMPIVAPPLGAATVPMNGAEEEPVRAAMLRLTQPFNLTGHPAISIPLPAVAGDARGGATGLPCGLQIVARDTRTALAVAAWCEFHLAVDADSNATAQ